MSEEDSIVIQEAKRMGRAEPPISKELAVEDSQRVTGASIDEITNAAAILCLSHGLDPRQSIGNAIMTMARTAIVVGARTAQRLNGNEVLK